MSAQELHIGRTKMVVEPSFGVHVLSFGVNGRPVQRVGTFDTAVAASHFVEALKTGLEAEGARWNDPRVGPQPLVDALAAANSALAIANAALDAIASRVTPDNYDNPSSALEAIGDAVMSTGRTIEGYDDDNE